jgi:methionyl aminopeptidase
MIYYKTNAEVELIRQSSKIVDGAIAAAAAAMQPGVSTLQLDAIAEKYIRSQGALPSFKGLYDFPFTACISVNDAVVHGFPTNTPLKEGDIVTIDIGAFREGFHGDSAYTFALKGATPEALRLMKVTKESLYKGIEKAVVNNRIGDIGAAIQDYCEKQNGYGIVRDLVGHGIGRTIHEDPQVPNYGKRGNGTKLQAGLVIAIEPMVNMGGREVYTDDKDDWTVRTKDGKPAAHFEHTICVQKNKADILSSFELIEAAEAANVWLVG